MVIVPVEKRFDWRHAPVFLFIIVLINILVFFLYQSGDDKKVYAAIDIYLEYNLLEADWPKYANWLREQGKTDELEEYEYLYEEGIHEELAGSMLFDSAFMDWLQAQPKPAPQNIDDYLDESFERNARARTEAREKIATVSWLAHGLVAKDLRIPALITHQFLHGDSMHLLGNLFFLVVCGFAVEAALGHLRFIIFYLLGGIGAGLAQAATDWSSTTPLVGASGAISGVMAMYLGIFRLRKIEFFYWFFFFVGYFRAPALLILPFYIGNEMYQYYSDPESSIAFMAHAGGFVTGAALMFGALLLNPRMLNKEYLEEKQGIDPAREKLAKVYAAIENFSFKTAHDTLNELIQEHGNNFEYATLRLNIFKMARSKNIKNCILDIFKLPRYSPAELGKLEALWQRYSTVTTELDAEAKIKLALKLADLPKSQTAKTIYTQLKQQGCSHQDMKMLEIKFQKLAHSAGQAR